LHQLKTHHFHKEKKMNVSLSKTALLTIFLILICNSFALAEKLPVFVSILPQKYFVEQIAKDKVDITVMVQPGDSPHTYEPRPSQMTALSKAKIYFSIGVGFENSWMERIQAVNPGINIVRTDQGIKKIPMTAHHHEEEHHGEEHHEDADHHDEHGEEHHEEVGHHDHHGEEHSGHEGLDPHIWLSPKLVKIQARTIVHALVTADPSNQGFYETNYKDFVKRLDQLDNKLHTMFKDQKQLKFMVFHPSWGYFAKAYGLEQIAIEIEGKNPKPAQLKELIKDARKNDISVIFVQPQSSTRSAKLIAKEIHGHIVFADPLAADWMANMTDIAEKFKEAHK
jgi:zinc transport system substrate-binding protein